MARTLARTLGNYRAILGIKQREMERRVGLVKGLWSRYENGKGLPSEANIEKICIYLRTQEPKVEKADALVAEIHGQWTRAMDYGKRRRSQRLSKSLRKAFKKKRRQNGNPSPKPKPKSKRPQTTITSHGGSPIRQAALRLFNSWMEAESKRDCAILRAALNAIMEQAEG